jgi:hypothetical protein
VFKSLLLTGETMTRRFCFETLSQVKGIGNVVKAAETSRDELHEEARSSVIMSSPRKERFHSPL